MKRLVIALITVWVLSACSSFNKMSAPLQSITGVAADVEVLRPAKSQLISLKTFAVAEFNGNAGPQVSKALAKELSNSERFDLVTSSELNRLLAHIEGEPRVLSSITLAKVNEAIEADALVMGVAEMDFDRSNESKELNGKDGKTKRYVSKAKAEVKVSLMVLELDSGRILNSYKFAKKARDTGVRTGKRPRIKSQSRLEKEAMAKTEESVISAITPYRKTIRVRFESDGDANSAQAFDLAQKGQLTESLVFFKAATESDPSDATTWFNYGLALTYTQNFEEARDSFLRAMELSTKEKYSKALGTLRMEQELFDKLQQQLDAPNE